MTMMTTMTVTPDIEPMIIHITIEGRPPFSSWSVQINTHGLNTGRIVVIVTKAKSVLNRWFVCVSRGIYLNAFILVWLLERRRALDQISIQIK